MVDARKITVKVDADSSGYSRGMRKAESDTKTFTSRASRGFGNLKAGIAGAAGPIAGVAAGLAGAAVVAWDLAKAAAEDARAASTLAGTLERVTGATKADVDAVEEWISARALAVGVADDELRPALGRLATVTGDVTEAQTLLNLALDIQAQTGKPLEAVVKALGRAYSGSTGPLEKLTGLTFDGGKNAGTWATTQQRLNEKFGGAAAQRAETSAQKFERMSIAFDEAQEALGAELLPYLEDFASWVTSPEGGQTIADFVDTIGDGVEALKTFYEWVERLNNFVPDGFLWKFRADPDDYWPDRWPWQTSATGSTTARATTSAVSAASAPGVVVYGALDPQETARAVQRVVQGGNARAGRKRFL